MAGAIRNIFVEFQLKAGKLVAELKSVDKAADKSKLKIESITESLKKHRGALLGVSAATGLVARGMIKGAAAEEVYRLNIKSLTADTIEGQKELEAYYYLIDNVPDFVSKEQRAGLISQLKLFGLGRDEIIKLTPEIERLGIATGRTVDEVSAAFASALAGQYRSLQTMGIRIRESDIQDYIKENREEMQGMTKDQQRFAALTGVFMPQAADKIGEFGDVEKSSFVQTQKLNAAISDLSGDVGATLLPAVILVTKGLSGFVRILNKIPYGTTIIGLATISALMLALAGLAIPPLIAGIGFLGVSFTGGTITTTGFAAAMTGLATSIWAVLAPLLPFIALGAVLLLVIQDLWTGIKGGESVIINFVGWLGKITGITDIAKNLIGEFGDKLLFLLGPIGVVIYAFKNFDKIIAFITPAFTKIIGKLKGFGALFKQAGLFLIDTFIKGMTFGLLDTKKLTNVFNGIREYLPFSDATKGPLSDLTLSGQKFMQTFASGAEKEKGIFGKLFEMTPLGMLMSGTLSGKMGGLLDTAKETAGGAVGSVVGGTNITVNISDVKLSGDDASLQKFGEVAVAAVEKALGKINQKQATSAGY